MSAPIRQSIILKASPAVLFDAFLDSKKHSQITGAPAKVSRRPGGRFTAFGGALSGHNLLLVPGRMIVQAWRSAAWKKADPDSVLVVRFEKTSNGAAAYLAHIGVPQYDHKGVIQGWKKYYWKPWKLYLAGPKRIP